MHSVLALVDCAVECIISEHIVDTTNVVWTLQTRLLL